MTRRRLLGVPLAAPLLAQHGSSSGRPRIELGPERLVARDLAWPYLGQLRDGTTVVFGHIGWPQGGKYPDHYTAVSRDGRKTWTVWKPSPAQGVGPVTEGVHVELRDGTLLVFDVHAEHTGAKRFQHDYWVSRDSLRTLEGPFPYSFSLPQADTGGVDDRGEPISRIYVRRSMIELPGGDLIACAYGRFETDKMPVEYIAGMSKMRSFVLRSADRGKTWRYIATISADPVEQEGPCEPVMERLRHGPNKGRLICLLRSGRENPIYQCESDDEGATWTKAYPIEWRYSRFGRSRPIVGVDPDLVEMSDGTLAMSFGHKPDFEDHGNFAALSLDHGKTWSEVVRLSSSVTQAYTGIREVAPGELYAVYTISGRVQSAGYRGARFDTGGRSIFVRRTDMSDQLQWSDRRPMPRAEAGCAAAALGGELVLAGGTAWEGGVKRFLNTVQIYDPRADKWRDGPPCPEPLAYAPFVQSDDGLEVFGTNDGASPGRHIWRLDAPKSNWTRGGEAPADFSMGRAARIGQDVFVFGGGSDDVWRRAGAGEWKKISRLPGGHVQLSAIAAANGKVYLFGGFSMKGAEVVNTAAAYEFDSQAAAWKRLRDMPIASRGTVGLGIGARIYLFGGYGEGFLDNVWIYDIAKDAYRDDAPMPVPLIGADMFAIDGVILGAGGEDRMKNRSARTLAAGVPKG